MAHHYPESWKSRIEREDTINGVLDRFNLASNTVRIKQLTLDDEKPLFELSCLASNHTPFFATSIGLTNEKMPMYWKGINRALLSDPHAVVLGAFQQNTLVAVTSFATKSFPNPRNSLSLLWRFTTTMGLRSTMSFLAAIRNYEELFPTQKELDYATVMRGVWLYSHPLVTCEGAGRVLVTVAIRTINALGFNSLQLACDGSSEKLLRYYRLLGGSVAWEKKYQGMKLAMVAWQF